MTLPTDEEIQQAAAEHAQDIQTIIPEHAAQHAFGAHLAGARWALSQTTTLKWKRPEEELPTLEDDNVHVCTAMGVWPTYFSHVDNAWCYAAPRPGPNPIDWSKVIAWARIPLPAWLEGKE